MNRRRDLIVANLAGLGILLVVLLLGWWQEAAFGLAVLVILDLVVILRERVPRSSRDSKGQDDQGNP